MAQFKVLHQVTMDEYMQWLCDVVYSRCCCTPCLGGVDWVATDGMCQYGHKQDLGYMTVNMLWLDAASGVASRSE